MRTFLVTSAVALALVAPLGPGVGSFHIGGAHVALAQSSSDYDDAPDPDEYEDALAPYGRWVEHPEYGRVWTPAVPSDWRPYVDGFWVWTDAGWTWSSSEPWSWTFHYGRWAFDARIGWVWVPGTEWGPAWVDWYDDDGYVGWAPLPPSSAHVSFATTFVFVPENDFCSHRLRNVVVFHDRAPARVRQHWDDRGQWRDRAGFRPPEMTHIRSVAQEPVQVLDVHRFRREHAAEIPHPHHERGDRARGHDRGNESDGMRGVDVNRHHGDDRDDSRRRHDDESQPGTGSVLRAPRGNDRDRGEGSAAERARGEEQRNADRAEHLQHRTRDETPAGHERAEEQAQRAQERAQQLDERHGGDRGANGEHAQRGEHGDDARHGGAVQHGHSAASNADGGAHGPTVPPLQMPSDRAR